MATKMFMVFMVARLRRAFSLFGLAVVCAIAAISCQRVPLLAPSGSTISLRSGVGVLPLNGTTELIAQVIEPSGTPPQQGTRVSFTTTLGTIQPADVETDISGQARATFFAGAASGMATVSAISGGVSAGDKGSIKIAVGAAAVGGVTITASPSTVPSGGGTSVLTAKVLDTGGNALPNAPVTFSSDAGALSATVVNTDSSGSASTSLFTTKTAKVTATAGLPSTSSGSGGTSTTTPASSASTTVTVNATGSITAASATPNPAAVGQTVTVGLTYGSTASGASPITSVRVDWGDGVVQTFSGQPPAVTHAYGRDGSYAILITGTDAFGDTSSAFSSVTVSPRVPPSASISASPNPAKPGDTVTFTVKADVGTGSPTGTTIRDVRVDFGDGSSADLGASSGTTTVPHIYQSNATYNATVTAVDSNGQSTTAATQVIIKTP